MQPITVVILIAIAIIIFLLWVAMRLLSKYEHQKMLYESVCVWNELLSKKVSEYESKMDKNLFTFKYSARMLVGVAGEWYRCNYLSQSDDGKEFIKDRDFDWILRSELPNPMLEAQPIEKTK